MANNTDIQITKLNVETFKDAIQRAFASLIRRFWRDLQRPGRTHRPRTRSLAPAFLAS